MHPRVQKFYPVLGLVSGKRLLWHFQTPVLCWINVSLREGDFRTMHGSEGVQTMVPDHGFTRVADRAGTSGPISSDANL